MRKKYLILAMALLLIVGVGASSIAYFTSQDETTNVFTVGDVKITLTEDPWDPSEDHVMGPDVSFEKKPIVTNVGENGAYVRLVVSVSLQDALKNAAGSDFDSSTLFDGYDNTKWILANEPIVDGNQTITYIYNYYKVLEPGQKTEALFNAITFPHEFDLSAFDSIDEDVEVKIYADAIQSDTFENAEEAFTAFENE